MKHQTLLFILLILSALLYTYVLANTECVWATGSLVCHKNQSSVVGAIVELWDRDGSRDFRLSNPTDPDDKAGFTIVEDPAGLFEVEGCANDFDWLGLKNQPEFYLKVFHHCNTLDGEKLQIERLFRVFTPNTYDYHISHPIELD